MPKTRAQKEEIVSQIQENFSRAKSVIFARVSGVGVNDINAFRARARKEDVEYVVAKKTLLSIAASNTGLSLDMRDLDGQVAMLFGFKDEVAPAKLLGGFMKDRETVSFLGGILDGKTIDQYSAIALAKLPSREELLGKLVATINAPRAGLVRVLAGPMRALTQSIYQISQSKQ